MGVVVIVLVVKVVYRRCYGVDVERVVFSSGLDVRLPMGSLGTNIRDSLALLFNVNKL